MNNNSIDNMTMFELKIMNEYVALNDILFARTKEDADKIYDACERVIKSRGNTDPSVIPTVKRNYVVQLSELIEKDVQSSEAARECVVDIISYLHKYYAMVFSKINMVDSNNGQISSFDLCNNYLICADSLDELNTVLSQKQD